MGIRKKIDDIKKLKFYFIRGNFQCGNCKGFHWHILQGMKRTRNIECKCHCHLRWSMFKNRSAIEHLLEFPPDKCNCIVCRYMQNKKNMIKLDVFF